MRTETVFLQEGRKDVRLNAYITAAGTDAEGRPVRRPAVLILPGGAHISVSHHGNEGDPVAMAFVADGYQAYVLEYSVQSRAPEGGSHFPAPVLDIGRAMLMIRSCADRWYTDPERVSLIGFSAGAQLSALYSATWHHALFSDTLGASAEDFRPLATLLLYGTYDYRTMLAPDIEQYRETGKLNPGLAMQRAVFETVPPGEEEMDRWSAYRQLDEHMPPTFLAAAMDDDVCSPMGSLALARRLYEMGVPCELHLFRLGGHGFGIGTNFDEPWRAERRMRAAEWLPLAKTFLTGILTPSTTDKDKTDFGAKLIEELQGQ